MISTERIMKMKSSTKRPKLAVRRNPLANIEAVGLNTISSEYPGIRVTDIRSAVDGLSSCNSVSDSKLERTGGPLDLLIGSDLSNLHPKGVTDIGKLTLMRSNFGTGWTVMGHNKNLVGRLFNSSKIIQQFASFCGFEAVGFRSIIEEFQ